MNINNQYNRIDFTKDYNRLKIKVKNILIIGGAGTIGSNYLKEILKFKPKKIVVVDFNENA